jgi:hypothetical protein
MKSLMVVVVAMLAAGPVLAQSQAQNTPPMVGGKPLLQIKQAAPKPTPGKPLSLAVRMQKCLEIEDGSKGRLDCYDAVIPPQPKAKPVAAKGLMDCRYTKEQDERLACFNGFVESIPKLPGS